MITVADVENPPETDKYKRLKETLITKFTDSHEKQMQTLLLGIEFEDKKPSQLLREMKVLAGENAIETFGYSGCQAASRKYCLSSMTQI